MNFNKSSVLALATAPTAAFSWNCGPSYYSTTPLSLRLVETSSPVERMLKRQRVIAKRMFDIPSNPYRLIDNDEKFQLTVDVPGVKEEDIDIKLDDGQLTVEGQRIVVSESSRYASSFSQSFYLDPTVDVDSFTATLKDGVLVVSATKELSKLKENVRRIPITPLENILDEVEEKEVPVSAEGREEQVITVEEEETTKEEEEMDLDSPADSQTDTKNDSPDDSNDEKE